MAKPSPLVILAIFSAILGLLSPSCMADNVLYSGETLTTGQSLTSGSYSFTVEEDCVLVLRDAEDTVWSSGEPQERPGCTLVLQRDGNLVMYDYYRRIVWDSNTHGRVGDYVCILQRDGDVVVYGPAIWSASPQALGSAGVIKTRQSKLNSTVADAASEPGMRKIAMPVAHK